MEKMSEAELKQLRELQAKQKRVQRAEQEFLKEADSRKEELLERWNVQDQLKQAADLIGTDKETLFAWVISEEQMAFYRRRHGIMREG